MTQRARIPPYFTTRSAAAFDASSAQTRAATPPNQTSTSDSSPTSSGTLTDDSQLSAIERMADAYGAVTAGAFRRIFGGEDIPEPVLQCVQIKPMASNNGQERYRIVLNDTVNFIQSMIAQRELCPLGSTWWRRM